MTLTVKNRRLKISPQGVVSLPVSARRALGMIKGKGAVAYVSFANDVIHLSLDKTDGMPVRVSKGGQMVLGGAPRECLDRGIERHYWVEADDVEKMATLRPFLAPIN